MRTHPHHVARLHHGTTVGRRRHLTISPSPLGRKRLEIEQQLKEVQSVVKGTQ